jgi:hypothetical protein
VSTNNNKTITIKLTSATAYKKSPANNSNTGSSTGSYTYSQLSPISGIFAFVLTGEAKTAYIQLSFTSTTAGTYITLIYDDLGVLQDSDIGHFTL